MLLDPYKRPAERYGVKSLPALFVIDPEGIIRYSSTGYDKNTDFTGILEEAVESAQQEENAAVPDTSDTGSSEIVEAKTGHADLSTQQKYQAVIRVECGEKPADVADDIGVDIKTLKQWYNSIHEAVKTIWTEKTESE